jgi:hypothetical protein
LSTAHALRRRAVATPAAPVVTPTAASGDPARLKKLREQAARDPAGARQAAWDWLRELQAPAEHHRLHWLFAQGTAPELPDGDCEGIVMNLYGALWLTVVDRMVRLGQLLGGIGWTGKSFNRASGTGYNRLTASSRLAALLVMPGYRFQRVGRELVGFHFHHALEASPLTPNPQVCAIKYDAPEHANPLMLPNTRDEVVQIVPDVFLGRALFRASTDWKVVGYFGLRHPLGDK